MDGRRDGWTSDGSEGKEGRTIYGRTDIRTDGRTDGRTDEQMAMKTDER